MTDKPPPDDSVKSARRVVQSARSSEQRTDFAEHRTALASERTLYSVLRTGLSIAAGGTVVVELLGGHWPAWLKVLLAGTLVVAGYTMIITGLKKYETVANEVTTTGEGSVTIQSPRLMKVLVYTIQAVLAAVIVIFLLGLYGSGTAS